MNNAVEEKREDIMDIIANPIGEPFAFLLVSVVLSNLLNLFAGGLVLLVVTLLQLTYMDTIFFRGVCVCLLSISAIISLLEM